MKRFPRSVSAAGIILTTLLALPATGLAGPASAPATGGRERPRDIEQTVPPEQIRKSFDPLQYGYKISPKQAAARRHKCARAAYIVKQANGFKDESSLTVRYYQQALDLCPGHPEANFRLGVIFYNKKDTADAIKSFQRSVKSDPKFADGYYNLAIIYRQQKKKKEARKYFLTALKHDPRDSLALYNIGVLQYLALDRENALESFKKSATFNPKMAEPHFFIGALYQEQGLRKAAMEELRKSIRLNPKLTLPRVYLSAILETEGDSESARDELNKAMAINPSSVNIGYGVEEFYFQESKGNKILSHIRVRRMDAPPKQMAKAEPPAKTPVSKAAPETAKPLPGTAAPPKKETEKKRVIETRREAREIPVRPAPKKKRASVPKARKKKRPKKNNFYRVRRGDTLAKIAIRYGTSVKFLSGLNHNRIEHPSLIEIGDLIRVPRRSPKARARLLKKQRAAKIRAARRKRLLRKPYRLYRIKRGDTLAKISRRFRIGMKTLLRLNQSRIEHPDYLEVGRKIRVPVSPGKIQAKK